MASHESALKAHRQSLKNRERNRQFRSRLRNALKTIRAAIDGNDLAGAKSGLKQTISLAQRYPFLFETQLRPNGTIDFQTDLDDFDSVYPGTYAGRPLAAGSRQLSRRLFRELQCFRDCGSRRPTGQQLQRHGRFYRRLQLAGQQRRARPRR